MLIHALLGDAIRRCILADHWLSAFDWVFVDDIALLSDGRPDLLIADLACLASIASLDSVRHDRAWLFLSDLDYPLDGIGSFFVLPGQADKDVIKDRLTAWLWISQSISPIVFPRASFEVVDGVLSLYRAPAAHSCHLFPLELFVIPIGGVGGDVAIRADFGGKTLLVLADSTGHGYGAAFGAALITLAVSQFLDGKPLSSEVIRQVNDFLYWRTADDRFVAAVIVELDWSTSTISMLNLGMPDILMFNMGLFQQRFSSSSFPLGLARDLGDVSIETLTLQPSSQFLIHSDGIESQELRYLLANVIKLTTAFHQEKKSGFVPFNLPLSFAESLNDDKSCLALSIPPRNFFD